MTLICTSLGNDKDIACEERICVKKFIGKKS